jgi:hypothetical protein
MDRDVKRPVTNGEHDKHDLYNLDERVGHIGSKTGKWDNEMFWRSQGAYQFSERH